MLKRTTKKKKTPQRSTPLSTKMAPHPSQIFTQHGEHSEIDKLDEALGNSFQDGWQSAMLYVHKLMLEKAEACQKNNSSITYVGLRAIAWDYHNYSKDNTAWLPKK